MTTPPLLSIVIPTFNGGPLFAEVLAGIKRQQPHAPDAPPPQLLIIDSGSTDNTLQQARDAGAQVLSIPQNEFDHGLTRNRGIEMATGDIVVLMTQDAVPADDNVFASLAAPFDDPAVAGVFARQIPRPEADALTMRNLTHWVTGGRKRRISQITDRPAYDAMDPHEKYIFCVFDNVCSAVRRSAWRDLPFHANAFGEDIEWAKRALEAGWKIVYEPAAAVVHSHDRPVAYEYKRTYMCHHTLYKLFGLHTLKKGRYLPRAVLTGIGRDVCYTIMHQRGLSKKFALLAKIPSLVWASSLGQFRGARDARTGRGGRQAGV